VSERVIAIDLGATWTRVAVATPMGDLLSVSKWPTPRTSSEIKKSIQACLRKLHSEGVDRGAGVGIASVGLLSVKRGMILMAPNIGGIRLKIVDAVKSVHDGEVTLLNDCNAAALGEWRLGAGKNLHNLVYVTISTGIGGGAIVDGRLLLGKDGNAAEIGHLVLDHGSGIRCGCGGYGHWEAMCSGVGLMKLARHLTGEDRWGNARELIEDFLRSDRRAKKVVETASRLNAAGLASLINAYDPEIVTVGGSIGLSHGGLLVKLATKYLSRYQTVKARIRTTPLGEKAPLLGAAVAAGNPMLVRM